MSFETNIIFALTGKVISTLLSSAKYKFFISPITHDIVESKKINPKMKTIKFGETRPLENNSMGSNINTTYDTTVTIANFKTVNTILEIALCFEERKLKSSLSLSCIITSALRCFIN